MPNVKLRRPQRTVAYCTSLVAGDSWSVLDRCVSVFSLCGLCLFIVDSTVERYIPLLTVSLELRVKMSIWVFNSAALSASPWWLRAFL